MFEQYNKKKGFSLIEALVAVGILSLGLVAVLGVFPLTLQVNKQSEKLSLASVYARTQLEQLSKLSYDDLPVGTYEARAKLAASINDPAYYLDRQTIINYVDSDLQNSASDNNLKKIIVTVFWKNKYAQDQTYVLTTLVTRK